MRFTKSYLINFQRYLNLPWNRHGNSGQKICRLLSTLSSPAETRKNIIHSPAKDVQLSEITIPQFVFQNFGRYPNKIAVECCLTGRKYTFEQLRRKSRNFGKALRKRLKLVKGDVVALILPNIPEFPISLLGALDAGLVVTTLNPSYRPDEMKNQLVDSDSKLIITTGQFWPLAEAATKQSSHTIPIIAIKTLESETLPNGSINFQELVQTDYDIEDIKNADLDDLAILPYSSGTTGLPKGVELTNRNVLSNLAQVADPYFPMSAETTENHQDVVPGILPWFHIYGITVILLSNLQNMSKFVSLPKFTPDIYVNMLSTHKPQLLHIAPPIVILMNNSSFIKKQHLQSINLICSGAAPLGAIEEEKLKQKADKDIMLIQGYGLTESSCCVTMLSPLKKREVNVYGSVGEPVGGTSIKLVPTDNVHGEPLGQNQSGEILVKGPQMTKRYHNRPQETEEAFVDGWFRTGDVGYYDRHGCFYITDCLKELIKVKGFQVAPAELEELLRAYPGVVDSAVIGIPHARFGEVPRAYIIQDKNCNLNTKKLDEYVSSKVSDYKRLKGGIVLIDSIPKTASGKILRKDLKKLYENECK